MKTKHDREIESKALDGSWKWSTEESWMPDVPRVGMTTECHGQQCRIIAVHYPDTLDVESPSGKCFRISGLWFPKGDVLKK